MESTHIYAQNKSAIWHYLCRARYSQPIRAHSLWIQECTPSYNLTQAGMYEFDVFQSPISTHREPYQRHMVVSQQRAGRSYSIRRGTGPRTRHSGLHSAASSAESFRPSEQGKLHETRLKEPRRGSLGWWSQYSKNRILSGAGGGSSYPRVISALFPSCLSAPQKLTTHRLRTKKR